MSLTGEGCEQYDDENAESMAALLLMADRDVFDPTPTLADSPWIADLDDDEPTS